jgi:hypothetical protein
MSLTLDYFLDLAQLNPLLARQLLIQAVDASDVSFPKGTSDASLLDYLWQSPLIFLEPEADSPDSDVLASHYGSYQLPEGAKPAPILGFPLASILQLLEMVGNGQHPRFCAWVRETLFEWTDPEFAGYPETITFSSPH